MSTWNSVWQELIKGTRSEELLAAAMYHTAQNLSEMLGRPIDIDAPRVEKIPIHEVVSHAGGPETEMVGIYLLIDGDLGGQAVLMLSTREALQLVDLLMGLPEGTTTALGELERSALAETGNLTVSGFLNAVAALTGTPARPSPPAVVVDMVGAILDAIATTVAMVSDELFIVETTFREPDRAMKVRFWVLPDPRALVAEGVGQPLNEAV